MNMQASHNEGVTQTLTDIRATLAEVTVIQSEEKDGARGVNVPHLARTPIGLCRCREGIRR